MINFSEFAERLDDNNGIPTAEIIAEIIKEHEPLGKEAREKYGRYQLDKKDTPIMNREFEGDAANKINNKLANDYFGEIVDTKVGYMFGMPMAIHFEKDRDQHLECVDAIDRFVKLNNLDDLNAEFCKMAAIGGYDAGLCYIDKEGQERVIRVNAWEAVIISKTNFTEPEYGLRYFETWEGKARAEFYNDTNKIVFEGADFSNLSEVENKPHMFKYCPLFGIPNNSELDGDADKVFSLIDAYDRSISDMNNEIEQFRLAYMIFVGYEPDEETIENMRKTGALFIPTSADGEKIDWLIKQLDPAYPDSHLDRLEANIIRFSNHVNFTDAAFGRDITGPAMRYKLFALETKSKYFERKHEAAMLHMFKVIGSAWQTKGLPFDYMLLDMVYTRNIPVNLLDEAQTATALSAIASKRTALSVLSVINDVDKELERMEQEKEDYVDLDKLIDEERKRRELSNQDDEDEDGDE